MTEELLDTRSAPGPFAAGPGSSALPPSGLRPWLSIVALALGIFMLITIEELPIGVLTLMADDLVISRGLAGMSITLPGIIAAVVALLAPLFARRLDRRLVLVIALGCVVVSSAATALSTGVVTLLGSRVLTGFAIGLYWATLPIVAIRQLAREHAGRALTVAFAGTGAALVLGVPLASWIGTHLGWREAFGVVAAVSAVVALIQLVLVRPVRTEQAMALRDLGRAARTRPVLTAAALTALIVTGQFVTYGYVSPLLQDVAGIGVDVIPMLLLVFGIAGLIGNFAISPVVRRSPGAAVGLVAAGMAVSLVLLLLLARGEGPAVAVMAVWGLFAGAVSVSIQSFVTRHAGRFEEAGTAVNAAMFNIAIGGGAFLGGGILDAAGVRWNAIASVVLIVLGVGVALSWVLRTDREHAAPAPAPR